MPSLSSDLRESPSTEELNDLVTLVTQSRFAETVQAAQALTIRFPDCGFVQKVMGVSLSLSGRAAVAVSPLQRAVRLNPSDDEAHLNLGKICNSLGRFDEAADCFDRALEIAPDNADGHCNRGNVLAKAGRCPEALASCRRSLELDPGLAEAYITIGNVQRDAGQFDEAAVAYRRALSSRPGFANAYNALGNLEKDRGRFETAAELYRLALQFAPGHAIAGSNLGIVLSDLGCSDAAREWLVRSVAVDPGFISALSNLLFLHCRCGLPPAQTKVWARQFANLVEARARPFTAWNCSPVVERNLRVGLVSGDLGQHPVGYFLEGLLAANDRTSERRIEFYGYPSSARSDTLTNRIKACCRGWHSAVGLSDERLARRIHEDRIDVLIDLSGHTVHNRLAMFAWRPAPVQVSYLGYPGTTGLAAIGYRLTDGWADPVGSGEYYSEQLVRLPETAWCFTPDQGSPEVGELPCESTGHLTFGCFNKYEKITEEMLRRWAEILRRVPGARLALKNRALASGRVVQRLRQRFEAWGLAPERLELWPPQLSARDHLACYRRLDIALDTFPYHGTTTTCEALWMGVPVISLVGEAHISRVGVSLLRNAGLPECIAADGGAYVEAAVGIAADRSRLAELRSGLRRRLTASPLLDAPRFSRDFESALREIWSRWCAENVGR